MRRDASRARSLADDNLVCLSPAIYIRDDAQLGGVTPSRVQPGRPDECHPPRRLAFSSKDSASVPRSRRAAVVIRTMIWPGGKRFAFTIFDDTDGATLDSVRPVYDFLGELGLRTTKTVWPLRGAGKPVTGGATLEDHDYRDWILSLRAEGFEIASHGTSDQSSPRARILAGFDRFREVVGADPRAYANHTGQKEAIYWGAARLDGGPRAVYRLANRWRSEDRRYFGEDQRSDYFWGDLCASRLTYVRNLVFPDIDTTSRDPIMPYHDPGRPFVPYWFSSSEGATCDSFCRTIAEGEQDRLVGSGGACVMYTHFAFRFLSGGKLDPLFVRLMRRLAAHDGWFVPVSTLLDHLRTQGSRGRQADTGALRGMQWRWLAGKLLHGTS